MIGVTDGPHQVLYHGPKENAKNHIIIYLHDYAVEPKQINLFYLNSCPYVEVMLKFVLRQKVSLLDRETNSFHKPKIISMT